MRAYQDRPGGPWRVRPRVAPGASGRLNLALRVEGEAEAQVRAALIGELLELLRAAGHGTDLLTTAAEQLAAARAADLPAHEALLRRTAGGLYARTSTPRVTVRAFGERWTSGQLARDYPDQVRVLRSDKAEKNLRKWVYPAMGDLPLQAVTMAQIQELTDRLRAVSQATRAGVLGMVRKLFERAVWPAGLLRASPFPAEYSVSRGGVRAFCYLYPSELERLLGCEVVPLRRRLAYGLLAHTGLRLSELLDLEWSRVDLERGAVRLVEHKTLESAGERVVPLEADVVEVLRWWRDEHPEHVRVLTWRGAHSAERLRGDLRRAGVVRPELHKTTTGRRAIRVHDLRATFVTLALAAGRGEEWVMVRTGHTTSAQVARYRRVARTAGELALGWLAPLTLTLPEAAAADRGGGGICPPIVKNSEQEARGQNPSYAPARIPAPPLPRICASAGLQTPLEGGVCGQAADRPLTARCHASTATCERS